jgi:hypothetical protein
VIIISMNTPESKVKGAGFAEFFSRGSQLVSRPLWLQRLVTGDDSIPGGWVHIERRADTIAPWVHFDGDPKGPRLPIPQLYRMAGLLAVEKSEMDELQVAHPQSRQAVAIRFDEAVVVGALAEGRSYPQSSEDEDMLLTRPLISRGDLDAAIGIYLPEQRDFLPASTAQSLGYLSLREA